MALSFRSKKKQANATNIVTSYRNIPDDPITRAMLPPKDETPTERAARLKRQQEATARSRQIDEILLESKKAFEKKERAIKILLLGMNLI